MILHPAIISLLSSSFMMSALSLYAAWYGVVILRKWDITSGSERQLGLERRTYLISTILSYVFGFQFFSLFLYIYTADSLCTLFTGAMCAAGTLQVNRYGYPALVLKLVNFVLAGLWLTVNYADNRGYDYPLVRIKYAFLLVLTPLLVADTLLQALFFVGLHPDVITSCCGSLFNASGKSITSSLASFPVVPMKMLFSFSMTAMLCSGIYFSWKGKGEYFFAAASAVAFPVSILSLLSFIAPYIYELPQHHCPFCLLQKEYGYVGYPLYITILGSVVSGVGTGVLSPFKTKTSLAAVVPKLQKGLALLSIVSGAFFVAIVLYRIFISELVL